MKKVQLFFILLMGSVIFYTGCISTKAPTYQVTPNPLETKGGKVSISVKGTFPEKSFNKKGALYLQPIVKYQGGTKALKPIIFQGEKAKGNGIVVNAKKGGTFTYNDVFDYDSKMNISEIVVNPIAFKAKEEVSGNLTLSEAKLKSKAVELGEIKIADGIIYTSERIQTDAVTSVAEHGYEKEVIITKNATLYFALDRDDLNFKLDLNKSLEAKLKLDELNAQLAKNWKIKGIEVNAWASPEGEESRNQGLSDRRSKTANKFMNEQFKKIYKEMAKQLKVKEKDITPVLSFNLQALGEDWNGFMKSVENSNINDKNIILNVVKSQVDFKLREQEIRNMTVIYKEIEDQILPALRRADIIVSLYEPKKTDEKIALLSTTFPDSLDNKEILYAATLTSESATKLKIYQSAITLFPNDWKAYNNAAVYSLQLGNVNEADTYIQKANALSPNNGIITNTLGAVALKKNDFVTAKSYFESAQKLNQNESYNLGVILIKEGKYSDALNSFAGKKCDYNLALAQMMNGNLEDAITTLNCSPKTAASYYLLAVAGARKGSMDLIIENLKKSINLDPIYKSQAKDDREFIKYFNSTEFINAIK